MKIMNILEIETKYTQSMGVAYFFQCIRLMKEIGLTIPEDT